MSPYALRALMKYENASLVGWANHVIKRRVFLDFPWISETNSNPEIT